MKTKLAVLLLVILPFISINATNKKIKGNGKLISLEISIGDFSSIQVNDLLVTINYKQDESKLPYLKYEIDENIIDYVSINVKDSILCINKVDQKTDLNYKELNIYTNSKQLSKINNTAIINLNIKDPITTKTFSLYNTGISNLDIINMNADNINLESTGIGNILIKGSTNTLSIESSGKTIFETDDLEANNVDIKSSGIDNIKVWAIKSINAEASGISKIRYKGNPTSEEVSKSGFSSIKKMK